MALNDSLDLGNDATYRTDYPVPHPVQNESEFVTNSGRRQKKEHSNRPAEQNPVDQQTPKNLTESNDLLPEISDSLQAALHLSLDRLSENSYDQDDLNRIKSKSQTSQSSNKTYPLISNKSQTEFEKAVQSQSPSFYHQANSGGYTSIKSCQPVALQGVVHTKDSLGSNGEKHDDDDDDSTVVADSLILEEGQAVAMSESGSQVRIADQHNSDPYAHLRYNPEWRNAANEAESARATEAMQGLQYMQRVDRDILDQDNEDDDLTPLNSAQHPGGAITLHNQDLLHVRNSPVRLSANPTRLLHMNQKYEEEFSRMLEQEKRWKVAEENEFESPYPIAIHGKERNQHLKSKLKPPISYKHRAQEILSNRAATDNFEKGSIKSQSAPNASLLQNTTESDTKSQAATATEKKQSEKQKKSIFAPTPPKAPKSHRDYIELNKTRLGRKSNSASYLEMYSKKNRFLERKKTTPRRPLSDIRRKEVKENDTRNEVNINDQQRISSLTVEEQWKQQADRLKNARDGKLSSKVNNTPKKTLREVGTQEMAKPNISPRELIGDPHRQLHQSPNSLSPHEAANSLKEKRFSPRHGQAYSPSDFSNHPAFISFSPQNSYRRELFNAGPHAPESVRDTTGVGNQTLNSTGTGYPYDYQTSDNSGTDYQSSGITGTGYPSGYQPFDSRSHFSDSSQFKQQTLPPKYFTQTPYLPQSFNSSNNWGHYQLQEFYHVRQEDLQNANNSPLMQAYHHHFGSGGEANHRHSQQHHQYSPSQALFEEDQFYAEHTNQTHDQKPAFLQRKNELERNSTRFAVEKPECNHNNPADPSYENFESSRLQAVPRLPPIYNATKPSSRKGERHHNNSEIVQQSLSDSEVQVGGYLEQHEKKKRKPAYKQSPKHMVAAGVQLPVPLTSPRAPLLFQRSTHWLSTASIFLALCDATSGLAMSTTVRYTLEDYKSLKRDINMGGLGPDLLTAKIKMEKIERAKKYAEFIRQQHKSNVVTVQNESSTEDGEGSSEGKSTLGYTKQRFTLGDTEEKKIELQERRKKALEYAKKVPKPKLVVASVASNENHGRDTAQSHYSHESEEANQLLEWDLLQSLRERHEREKALVAEMTSPNRVT